MQIAYAVIDVVLVCLIGIALVWLRFNVNVPFGIGRQTYSHLAATAYEGFFILYAALTVLGCASQNLYRTPRDRSVLDENLMVARAIGLATLILVLFVFTSGYRNISRLVVACSIALNIIALCGWRYLKRRLILHRAEAGIGLSRVLIIGSGRAGSDLDHLLRTQRQLGYLVCGRLDPNVTVGTKVADGLDNLRKIALTEFVDEIFITEPVEPNLVKQIALEARKLRLGLKIFPDVYDGLGFHAPFQRIAGFPVMDLHWQPIPTVGLAIKRFVDVVVAGIGLIVATPALCILALCIRLDSSGPAFYVANRVGFKGKKFRCYKLRTMTADAEVKKNELRGANERQGPFFKMRNDPRVTKVGRFLRKYSLDEIPQLWNVVRGDMSLVGPRPHPLDDYARYEIEHLRRLDVNPGLTGLWQVTSRSDPSFETNMALDLEYIENWTLGLDVKILLRTIPAALKGEGR